MDRDDFPYSPISFLEASTLGFLNPRFPRSLLLLLEWIAFRSIEYPVEFRRPDGDQIGNDPETHRGQLKNIYGAPEGIHSPRGPSKMEVFSLRNRLGTPLFRFLAGWTL